jgi:hypothetical protein
MMQVVYLSLLLLYTADAYRSLQSISKSNHYSHRGRLFAVTSDISDISAAQKTSSVFTVSEGTSVETLKTQILQLGASLDRGQAFNPTSGNYYADRMAVARLDRSSVMIITS